MDNLVTPVKPGQICKTLAPLENERQGDVYIITDEEPAEPGCIVAVSLNGLQRNVKDPAKAERKLIEIANLTVVGENLEDYVASWNK